MLRNLIEHFPNHARSPFRNRCPLGRAISIYVPTLQMCCEVNIVPIDLNDDVVAEIYDSWYSFFGVTRELIKSIPVSKVRKDSTGKIIGLSIEVLNEGLRPHLTKWQARFRRWYESEMDTAKGDAPQEVQKRFEQYAELEQDLMEVNRALITYREKMYDLLSGK